MGKKENYFIIAAASLKNRIPCFCSLCSFDFGRFQPLPARNKSSLLCFILPFRSYSLTWPRELPFPILSCTHRPALILFLFYEPVYAGECFRCVCEGEKESVRKGYGGERGGDEVSEFSTVRSSSLWLWPAGRTFPPPVTPLIRPLWYFVPTVVDVVVVIVGGTTQHNTFRCVLFGSYTLAWIAKAS